MFWKVPNLSKFRNFHAGDIGAIAKLASVQTGDSLAAKASPVLYPKAVISTPYTYKRYKAVKKGDEDKIAQGTCKNGK